VPLPLDTNEPIETGAVVPGLYSPRRARRRLALGIIGAAVVVVAAIGVAAIGLRHSHVKDTTSAPPTTNVASTTGASPAANATPGAATPATVPPSAATAAPTAAATPVASAASSGAAAADDEYGMVQTKLPSSVGHRITVDGHSLGDAPGPFRVRCGLRKVQIGSHGKPHHVQVACGTTTDLD
jgi:hypothetical protein